MSNTLRRKEPDATYARRQVVGAAFATFLVVGGVLEARSAISTKTYESGEKNALVRKLDRPVSDVQRELASGAISRSSVVKIEVPANRLSSTEASIVEPNVYSGYQAQEDDTTIMDAQRFQSVDSPGQSDTVYVPKYDAPDAPPAK
jgi:hypothetical protein